MKLGSSSPKHASSAGRHTLKNALTFMLVGSFVCLGAGVPAQAGQIERAGNNAQQVQAHQPTRTDNVASATLTEVKVPRTTMLGAAPIDLDAYGYTEREFYASGKAKRYDNSSSTSLETAKLIDGGWDYNTRVIVRTPENKKKFNGNLVVEWTNVTIGQDAEFVFNEAHEYLLREGYAVAVASPQRVGVEHLKGWSPKRYSNLSVDVNGCGDTGKALCTNDPASFDIFTQIAKGLKESTGSKGALAGLKVDNVIATGQSQSAIRLTNYYNRIQPVYNFFDGFVYWDRSTQLRSDLKTPAISVNSEALADQYAPVTTSEYTRAWDLAGSTHGSYFGAKYIDAQFKRDASLKNSSGKNISFTDWVSGSCAVLPPFTKVDVGMVVGAAFDSTAKWLKNGTAAPASKYFERDLAGKVTRGADGKVKGGIQLSQFAVPTTHNVAINGTGFPCSVSGYHLDYTKEALKSMYGNHQNYVKLVSQVMQDTRKAGYLLKEDEKIAVKDAQRSKVAR